MTFGVQEFIYRALPGRCRCALQSRRNGATSQERRWQRLRNSGRSGDDWLTYGLDYAETRHSPLRQINTANVQRLGPAWTSDVSLAYAGAGVRPEATPLVANGTLYWIVGRSVTVAIDARTGMEKWRYDPGASRGTGVVRGVALYDDKVFVPVVDGRLVALNAGTGRPVWTVQTTPENVPYAISGAPRVANGKVIIGNTGGEAALRGFVSAYNTESGRLIWRFYTVPGDPASGFENEAMARAAKTWSGEWYRMGGGGNVWDAITYDPDSNLVYVGTANGAPWPEVLRQSRGLDNLYIASVVALDANTGAYRWHFQFTPGDSWDYDATQQLTLATLRIGGRDRSVIMQANKNGFFYVLDRRTGEFISAEPFARLNWASGIDPKTGRPIVTPEARYGTQAVCITPGATGAHNWWPMSFSADTGLIYIPMTDWGPQALSVQENFVYDARRGLNIGIKGGGSCGAERSATSSSTPPAIGPVRTAPEGTDLAGWLIAWDPVLQKERWSTFGHGGTLATAGNLVFQVGGSFRAYDAGTGEQLIDIAIPSTLPEYMSPPVTFMLDGQQYVVFASHITSTTTGVPSSGQARPADVSRIYAFALDGIAPTP